MTQLRGPAGRTPPRRPAAGEPLAGGLTLAAARFFAARLAASWVPAYLADEGSANGRCGRGRVGYAPAGWRVLTVHLRDLGYGDTAIQAAGLARRTRRGALVDFFRDRAMFGIRWPDGTLAGFTGRTRPGGSRPGPVYLEQPDDRPVPQGQPALRPVRGTAGAGRGGAAGAGRGPAGRDRGERGRLIRGRLALRHRADPRPGHPARPDLRPAPGQRGRGLRRGSAGRQAAVRAHHLLRGVTDHAVAAVLPPGQDPAGFRRELGGRALARRLDAACPSSIW